MGTLGREGKLYISLKNYRQSVALIFWGIADSGKKRIPAFCFLFRIASNQDKFFLTVHGFFCVQD